MTRRPARRGATSATVPNKPCSTKSSRSTTPPSWPASPRRGAPCRATCSIGYSLKTPYRDGTTHVIVEPLDFIARLASLVPSPRVNLTRFRGVFIQGAVNLQGVTAFGTGTITSAVNNTGATIQGGSSGVAGTLTINGSLTQGSGGTIQELISGRSAGQFSQILVNGVVGLGGALDVVAATAAGIGVPAMKDPTEQRGLHSTCRSVNMKADSRFELSQSAVAPAPRCRECEH